MNETHDTIDGLLAEFRGYSAGMPPSYHVTMSWHDFRRMLDRFDAAHKREIEATAAKCCQLGRLAGYGASEIKHQQEPVGNAAKLREALETLLNLAYEAQDANGECGPKVCITAQSIIDEAKSALAAPPRNCDVGTVEEQSKRKIEFCYNQGGCFNCSFGKSATLTLCALALGADALRGRRRKVSGKIRNPARRCKICGGKCKRRMRYCKLCAKERKQETQK